jgi:hypothetical protein
MINQFVEKEVSKGVYTRFDLQRAYNVLEIDHPEEIDDDGVVAVYQSRCIDVPDRETEFRNALQMIQHFRKSNVIGDAATQTSDLRPGTVSLELANEIEMDVSEAYRRLRITDRDLGDDSVISAFVACV